MPPKRTLWSKLKPSQKFIRTWREHGYAQQPETEYRFSETRNFKLDYAFPEFKLGIEIHGFGWGHQAQQHLATDCEKIRHAIELGWLIIPFTTRCISTHEKCYDAVAYICRLLSERAEYDIPRTR